MEGNEGDGAMISQEKWDRLHNPKTAEDYTVSMTMEEMLEVPAAKPFAEEMLAHIALLVEAESIQPQIRANLERIIYGAICTHATAIPSSPLLPVSPAPPLGSDSTTPS